MYIRVSYSNMLEPGYTNIRVKNVTYGVRLSSACKVAVRVMPLVTSFFFFLLFSPIFVVSESKEERKQLLCAG